jgi:hypothetical protein
MHDVIGVLEGHWPTHFVSVTYSPYFFRTSWNHPFFPCVVMREDCVRRI